MKDFKEKAGADRPKASFVIGACALLFLIIGYQSALFIQRAGVLRIVANHDAPDTVYIATATVPPADSGATASSGTPSASYRRNAPHSAAAQDIRRSVTPRRYESFRFDPNTVSIDDLMRLGFSQKQAQSIDNYRKKGGRFRRKVDFARSYVVDDSVFRRLEPFIDIPKIDLNTADSAAFETLPGIGPFFAAKMVSYRGELGGYSYSEQLMDIWHFDREKFDGLKDLVTIRAETCRPYPLWELDEAALACHPYIGKHAAHGIVLFRDNNPPEACSVEALRKAGVLSEAQAEKLGRCLLVPRSGPGMVR